jgi:hypothetical protein
VTTSAANNEARTFADFHMTFYLIQTGSSFAILNQDDFSALA